MHRHRLAALILALVSASTASCARKPALPAASPAPVTLAAEDVTLIWPLPADGAQRDAMLGASSRGAHGELLPAGFYPLPVLDERDWAVKDPLEDRARLRVVAARLDPCFASFAGPRDPSCVSQIRLVLQVLRPGGGSLTSSGAMGANDGAVHVFYRIPREELVSLAGDLASLRKRHGASVMDRIGVHPLLARGAGGAEASELQALVLRHVGAERLTRVTFFARTAAKEPLWPFGIFDVVGGKLVGQKIPTVGVDRQKLEGAGPIKVVHSPTTSPDNPSSLLSIFGAPRPPSEKERAAYAAVLRIQNPAKHTPETMGCAECHASQRMQSAAESVLGLRPADFAADHFTPVVTPPAERIDAENFHACGYLGTNLSVSTRTANETSAVLAALNELLAR